MIGVTSLSHENNINIIFIIHQLQVITLIIIEKVVKFVEYICELIVYIVFSVDELLSIYTSMPFMTGISMSIKMRSKFFPEQWTSIASLPFLTTWFRMPRLSKSLWWNIWFIVSSSTTSAVILVGASSIVESPAPTLLRNPSSIPVLLFNISSLLVTQSLPINAQQTLVKFNCNKPLFFLFVRLFRNCNKLCNMRKRNKLTSVFLLIYLREGMRVEKSIFVYYMHKRTKEKNIAFISMQ